MAILLLFLIEAALTSADRRAVDLQREKATLLALKQGLTLPSAAALADWNESNSNVCGFTGITCDWRREHVVGLSLTTWASLALFHQSLASSRTSGASTCPTTTSLARYRRPSAISRDSRVSS